MTNAEAFYSQDITKTNLKPLYKFITCNLYAQFTFKFFSKVFFVVS